MANLRHSTALGRDIRIDEDDEHIGRSTWREAYDALDVGDHERARALFEYARGEHQAMLDSMVEWVWALLTWIQRSIGEEHVESAIRDTLGPYVQERYGKLHELSFDERVALTLEVMRGYLSGPGRLGDVQVARFDEGVTLTFDPCGSGGAALRGDPANGVMPASERQELGFADAAHDWTWGEEGVCLYCSHCSLVNEIMPIEHFGFPLRVTEPPLSSGDRCKWTIYADPTAVPDSAFERVGRVKPKAAP